MELLVAIDFSKSTNVVIEKAKEIAISSNSKIRLVHVAEPDPDFVGYEGGPQTVRDNLANKFHAEHEALQQYAEELREEGVDCVALLVQGATVETILREAEKLGIGIIVLGSHGRGAMMRMVVGSVSEGVLHRASMPVLVVPTHK